MYELIEYLVKSINLKPTYIDGFNSYNAMLEALENGKADILTTYPTELDLGKNSTIKVSKSVFTTPFVLIGKSSEANIGSINDALKLTVAVVKGYAQDRYLDKYSSIKKVYVKNNDEGFTAIRNGKAKYYINNLANSEY